MVRFVRFTIQLQLTIAAIQYQQYVTRGYRYMASIVPLKMDGLSKVI